MIRVGGVNVGEPWQDTEFCGLYYPDGDIITRHMAARLEAEPFYQHDKLAEALSFATRHRAAIDCGAWVGGWSREFSKHFESVIAIEANVENLRCARLNLQACKNVTVVHAAVGDRSGAAVAIREDGGANVGSRIVAIGAAAGPFDVALRRIDELPEVRALPAIDYIKIHVNGMELQALRGAVETIKKHRPLLTVVLKAAIDDYGVTAEEARMYLTNALRYRCIGGERPYEIWSPL